MKTPPKGSMLTANDQRAAADQCRGAGVRHMTEEAKGSQATDAMVWQ